MQKRIRKKEIEDNCIILRREQTVNSRYYSLKLSEYETRAISIVSYLEDILVFGCRKLVKVANVVFEPSNSGKTICRNVPKPVSY
jgi:hypothetical protein